MLHVQLTACYTGDLEREQESHKTTRADLEELNAEINDI